MFRKLSERLVLSILFTIAELWVAFFLSTFVPQWVENALIWQMLLTTVLLCMWVLTGEVSGERKRAGSREGNGASDV